MLSEFLAHFSKNGQAVRQGMVRCVESILANPGIFVRMQSHQTFLEGLGLYKSRPDKGNSLTDCISMKAMLDENITEVLTNDEHFSQEGLSRLF